MLVERELTGEAKDVYQTHVLSQLVETAGYAQAREMGSLLKSQTATFADQRYWNFLTGYRSKISQSSLVSRKAPGLYLADSTDRYYALDSLRGKVIYLSFWASWCKPCVTAFPAKKKLAEQFKHAPVVFLNVAWNDRKGNWQKALRQHTPVGINLLAVDRWNERLSDKYAIDGILHYVLIDKEGRVVENKCDGPQTIAPQIEALLKR